MNTRIFPRDLPLFSLGETPIPATSLETRLETARRHLANLLPAAPRLIHGVLCRDPLLASLALISLWRGGHAAAPLPWRHPPDTLRRAMARLGAGVLWGGDGPGESLTGDSFATRSIQGLFNPGHAIEALPDSIAERGGASPRGDLYLFTSGSTGEPRIAVHSHDSLVANARQSLVRMPLAPEDGWLLNLPLFHVGGISILYRCALGGARVILPQGEAWPETVTHVSVVAAQLARLAGDPDGLESLKKRKVILLGGGPVPRDLADRLTSQGVPLHVTYGLTETASQVATSRFVGGDGKAPTVEPLPGTELRISPEGEILVKGPTLFLGYQEGDQIAPVRDRDGFFHTGDLGHLKDGLLQVTGRRDNLIISGGENIQPEEIEGALRRHPAMGEVVVVPIPHPVWGERPVAFFEGTPGLPPPNAQSLRSFLAESLPPYKIPDDFRPWPKDDRCRTGNGKVNRAFFKAIVQK